MTYDVEEAHVDTPDYQSDNNSPDPNIDHSDSNLASRDDTPETLKSSISGSSDWGAVANEKEGVWYDSGAPNSEEWSEEPPILSFTAPLPPPPNVLEICRIPIDGQRHPFLSSFLKKTRYTDIPFGTAHRLLNYIMHMLEEAAFDFLMLHTPGEMTVEGPAGVFKWRKCADELEVQWWVRHLRRHYFSRFSRLVAGEGIFADLDDLRCHAVHSWVYDTDQIRTAVGVLATVKDENRLSTLEKVLETIYHMYRKPTERTITDDEKRVAEVALGIVRTEPRTIHQLLCRVQELLENACFKYWQQHNPQRLTELKWDFSDTPYWGQLPPGTDPHGWDCPERVELQLWHDKHDLHWDFEQFPRRTEHYDPDITDHRYLRELLRSAVDLRNSAAHRSHEYSHRPLEEMLESAWNLAAELCDDAAEKEIGVLLEKDFLQSIFADQKPKFEARREYRKQLEAEARADWQQYLESNAEGKAPDTETSTKDT